MYCVYIPCQYCQNFVHRNFTAGMKKKNIYWRWSVFVMFAILQVFQCSTIRAAPCIHFHTSVAKIELVLITIWQWILTIMFDLIYLRNEEIESYGKRNGVIWTIHRHFSISFRRFCGSRGICMSVYFSVLGLVCTRYFSAWDFPK